VEENRIEFQVLIKSSLGRPHKRRFFKKKENWERVDDTTEMLKGGRIQTALSHSKRSMRKHQRKIKMGNKQCVLFFVIFCVVVVCSILAVCQYFRGI
jgi:hypothetical protein